MSDISHWAEPGGCRADLSLLAPETTQGPATSNSQPTIGSQPPTTPNPPSSRCSDAGGDPNDDRPLETIGPHLKAFLQEFLWSYRQTVSYEPLLGYLNDPVEKSAPGQFIIAALRLGSSLQNIPAGGTSTAPGSSSSVLENFLDVDKWLKEYMRTQVSRHQSKVLQVEDSVYVLLHLFLDDFYDRAMHRLASIVRSALDHAEHTSGAILSVRDFVPPECFEDKETLDRLLQTATEWEANTPRDVPRAPLANRPKQPRRTRLTRRKTVRKGKSATQSDGVAKANDDLTPSEKGPTITIPPLKRKRTNSPSGEQTTQDSVIEPKDFLEGLWPWTFDALSLPREPLAPQYHTAWVPEFGSMELPEVDPHSELCFSDSISDSFDSDTLPNDATSPFRFLPSVLPNLFASQGLVVDQNLRLPKPSFEENGASLWDGINQCAISSPRAKPVSSRASTDEGNVNPNPNNPSSASPPTTPDSKVRESAVAAGTTSRNAVPTSDLGSVTLTAVEEGEDLGEPSRPSVSEEDTVEQQPLSNCSDAHSEPDGRPVKH